MSAGLPRSDERHLRALLVAVAAEDEVAARSHADALVLSGPAGEQLVRRAAQHRTSRALHASAVRRRLGAAARAELEAGCLASAAEHLRISADLRRVTSALTSSGVPHMVVKGPVVAQLLHRRPELRQYADLDVVVDPGDFPRGVARLEQAGARVLDQNWALLRAEQRGQLHLRMPNGTVVDLHWHLLNRSEVRRAFAVPGPAELHEAGREVVVDGLPVRTLDVEATLLHLCLHAALSGGDRLSWLRDVDRAVVVAAPSWDAVVRTAQQWRARSVVGAVLLRAAGVFGTPVPASVVRALLPGHRSSAFRLVDRALPVPAGPVRSSLLALGTPSLRDRGLGVSPRLRRRIAPWTRGAGVTEVTEVSEHGLRARYLADVARAGR